MVFSVDCNVKEKIMRKQVLFILVFIISIQLFAQEQIGIRFEKRRIDTEFSIDKLYNKKTGKRVSQKEFEKLIKQNQNLSIEPVYDNKGNIVKYFYDPDESNSLSTSNIDESVKIGAYYPELIFKTIDGETIKLKDLKGKMVILRFEMEADTFRFRKLEIEEMDQGINESQRGSEIEAIIIFDATKHQIRKGFDLTNSNFKLVPNGVNFQRKMNIRRFPSTVILDKQGRLIEELPMSEGIDILELLNKS